MILGLCRPCRIPPQLQKLQTQLLRPQVTHQLSKLWQARATWCIWCYLFNLNNRACQALFNSHFPHPSYIWFFFDEFRSPKEQESNLFPTQPFGVLFAGLPKFLSYFPQASLIIMSIHLLGISEWCTRCTPLHPLWGSWRCHPCGKLSCTML